MSRDITNFKSFWKTTTFSSIVDPTIYLLAFGLGFGALVSTVNGIDYLYFVGTGMVATAVLFSSVFSAMYGVFIKHRFQHTYDAILAAPVDVEELATAEVLWIGIRAGVYGMTPLLVAILFGLDPSWGMLVVPFIGAVTALGFAALGVFAAASVSKIDHFNYIQTRAHHAAVPHLRHVLPDRRAAARLRDRVEPQPALSLRRARAPRGRVRVRDRRPVARGLPDRVRAGELAARRLAAREALN